MRKLYRIVSMMFMLAPIAVVGGLSSFAAGSRSSDNDRGWMMLWLVVGQCHQHGCTLSGHYSVRPLRPGSVLSSLPLPMLCIILSPFRSGFLLLGIWSRWRECWETTVFVRGLILQNIHLKSAVQSMSYGV
ncbi:hypothetical protein B0H63DRAFT_480588 [Podospora didyma]|uniref:Secreted protein n=1 Tax=Podospora didyma TaxID=330526 RepID=A0AAE0KDN6_9PEZI|nr:hypothetical protein B0H63DRAFT_480588 [Podospora didyma]